MGVNIKIALNSAEIEQLLPPNNGSSKPIFEGFNVGFQNLLIIND